MRLHLPRPSSAPHPYALVAWTAGVVLLTPLILLGGLVAVVALAAVTLSRRTGRATPVRRPAPALPAVLRLKVSPAESSLGVVASRRAA